MPAQRPAASTNDSCSDSESSVDHNPQSEDAGTGSNAGETMEARDAAVAEEQTARIVRIKFLAIALTATLVTSIVGLIAYFMTNSLAIGVDFVCELADVISLGINILVEFAKGRATSTNTIRVLDFGGGLTSLILLLGVAFVGVYQAQVRSHEDFSPRFHIHHINLMLAYNIFSLMADTVSLFFWARWRDLMAGSQKNPDRLNVSSGLIHTLVDFVRNVCVTLTTFWMIYIVHTEKNQRKVFKEQVDGDVAGSYLICSCALVSSGFLLKESLETIWKIWHRQIRGSESAEKKGSKYGAV